jgi:hypothetical protein
MHPEKVLAVRGSFATSREEEHVSLVAALIAACRYCDDPSHADELAELLSRRAYLNLSAKLIRRGLSGRFEHGHEREEAAPDFTVFQRENANEPSREKAAWICRHVLSLAGRTALPPGAPAQIFRTDLFARAVELERLRSGGRSPVTAPDTTTATSGPLSPERRDGAAEFLKHTPIAP